MLPVALAQSYPIKPIRVVVPDPQGGLDPSFRVMTPKMGEVLGQPVVVENRAGANGMFGPAGLPRPIAQRVIDAALVASKAPEVMQYYQRQGLNVTAVAHEQFGAMLRSDFERTAQLIRELGIKPE